MRIITVAILSLSVVGAGAQAKQSRDQFLQSKLSEAHDLCHTAVVATAKDPDSVKFLDSEYVLLGRGITRNNIYWTIPIMGRNTYGAVLKHLLECEVNCTEKSGCKIPRVTEQP